MRGTVVIVHTMMFAWCYLYTWSDVVFLRKPDKAEREASIASMRAITDHRPMTGHPCAVIPWHCCRCGARRFPGTAFLYEAKAMLHRGKKTAMGLPSLELLRLGIVCVKVKIARTSRSIAKYWAIS